MSSEIIEKLKKLETGMITDSLNLLGLGGWMIGMAPAKPEHFLVGQAFTLQYTYEADPSHEAYNYYTLLDQIKPGDVIVIAAQNGPYALMGENMQHAALRMGAAGIVLDGRIRDRGTIQKVNLPVFCRGGAIRFMPKEFKLTACNGPVSCGEITVRPGDYIIGDIDGVIAIPEDKVESVLYQAENIARIEKEMELAIDAGKSMAECVAIISQKKKPRP
jgi:regulator of RNase E activity RraA